MPMSHTPCLAPLNRLGGKNIILDRFQCFHVNEIISGNSPMWTLVFSKRQSFPLVWMGCKLDTNSIK